MFKRKLRFYALVNKTNPNLFLTITNKLKDCEEYAQGLIRVNHREHYKAWCDLRKYQEDNINVWNEYCQTCIPREEFDNYNILKIYYKKTDVVSMLRMFLGVPPIGASYETQEEQEYFIDKLNDSLSSIDIGEKGIDINGK